jgi:hypothetical protein
MAWLRPQSVLRPAPAFLLTWESGVAWIVERMPGKVHVIVY